MYGTAHTNDRTGFQRKTYLAALKQLCLDLDRLFPINILSPEGHLTKIHLELFFILLIDSPEFFEQF
jgi:hypothetical protein